MKRVFWLQMLLSLSILLQAQEASAIPDARQEVPPPPVVSALTAVYSDHTVHLSWTPVPNLTGESIVLRYDRPITASNYAEAATVGTVPATTTTFEDTIEDGKEYYYAILSRDNSGMLYDFFLPANNSLLVAVSTGEAERVEIAQITEFAVAGKDDSLYISWKSSVKNKTLVLYRSITPFADISSLLQAVVVSSISEDISHYTDYPIPGVPYYYAIIDEDAIHTGNVTFTAGTNTNEIPMEAAANTGTNRRAGLTVLRPMPLPYLNPSRTIGMPKYSFSAATEGIISELVNSAPKRKITEHAPYVFRSDFESISSGEEYTLKQLLEESLIPGKWDHLIQSLQKFLSIRRSAETTARVHFYLGEAYYFTGDYQQALLEFLLSRDYYYNQSGEWIGYTMDAMIL